jgi:hypothetical protein
VGGIYYDSIYAALGGIQMMIQKKESIHLLTIQIYGLNAAAISRAVFKIT